MHSDRPAEPECNRVRGRSTQPETNYERLPWILVCRRVDWFGCWGCNGRDAHCTEPVASHFCGTVFAAHPNGRTIRHDYALPAVKEDKTKPVLVSKLLIYFAFYAFGIAMTEPAMGN